MQAMFEKITPMRAAIGVFAIAFATIAGAWIFEYLGYAPCELCLMQRWAYYVGVPLAALAAVMNAEGPRVLRKPLLVLLAVIFAGSSIFGIYHAGVEWGFWPGPTGCTGTSMPTVSNMNDFMKQLQTTRVVRCDEVAIRIFGLSLAGWNAIISAGMAALAFIGFRAPARSVLPAIP
jgi:disulfide bond formation protein DsbB